MDMDNATTMSSVSNTTDSVLDEPLYDEVGLIPLSVPPQWAYNVELVMMLIVLLLGVPGNIIIIIVQAKTDKKTSTDYLVMIMAIYELLSSSVNTFLKIVADIHSLWIMVFSVFICKSTPVLYYIAQYGSAQTLGMLAVDRCIKTVFPLSTWYTNKHPLIISVFIFLISVVLGAPHAFTYTVIRSTKQCAFTLDDRELGKYFGVAGSVLSFVVFFVLAISYLLIAIALRRRHIKKLRQRSTQNMFKNLKDAANRDSEEEVVPTVTILATVEGKQDQHNGNGIESTGTNGTNGTSGHPDKGNGVAVVTKPIDKKQSKETKTKGGRSNILTMEGRNVNKLTVLMFLLSLIYIGTNSVLWYLFIMGPFELGVATLYLSFSLPMINCISNPVIFFSMSTRFRTNVKNLFCG